MAELPELIFQALVTLMIVAWLAFGGEKFASDYDPPKKWVVGANWLKRAFTQTKAGGAAAH